MNISAPFIKRPIATSLLAFGVALAGMLAFNFLPVSALPQVDFPTISVSASLPGASPEIMATSVATPLERQLGRIAGVTQMTSSSTLGSSNVILQFDLSRDIDGAARDVQAAINASLSQLPSNLPINPTYRKVNPADAPIMILTLTSDIYTTGQMYDVASTVLQQKISQAGGIGQVIVGGSSLPAVRVELNPSALSKYGISLPDVAAVLNAANVNHPTGQLTMGTKKHDITTNDQLFRAKQYAPLIITYQHNTPVKISDVANVIDSVENIRNAGLANGKPAVLLVLFKQPGANVIKTIDNVQAIMPLLRASIPASMTMSIMMDRTTTIRASLHDVEMTLIIAMLLVVVVTYLFLGSLRAMLIPGVAAPLSLLGTFTVMYLLGFSLNNLSMMALTISTGFVVDDAIVMLENINRHIEKGVDRFQAAIEGSREVGFTVLSMSLSLVAVFIPILLMSGIIGRLFREFAITLSVAILISLIVSLTVTPMMCAQFLKNDYDKQSNIFINFIGNVRKNYELSLRWALQHSRLMLLASMAALLATLILFVVIPKGFFPQQDTGRITASIQAEQNISFQAMKKKLVQFVEIVKKDKAVENVVGFVGSGGMNTANSGTMFVTLKALADREVSADGVINRLREKLSGITGASLYMQAAQDLVIGGRQGNAQYQYTLSADSLADLNKWVPLVAAELSKIPGIADINSDQRDHGLQTYVDIDHDAASRLGITTQLADSTLYNAFGQAQVSVIYTAKNQYHVVMEAAPQYWQQPKMLNDIYVISSGGNRVPLSAFARFTNSNTLLSVNHQGQAPAATLSFNLLPNMALGDAVNHIESVVKNKQLPASIHGAFQGTAQAFQASLSSEPFLILTALLAVYIVLGILYESLIHPITILSTLPSAGVGALVALLVTGIDLNVTSLIGLILLIGIVKKNAIMMIDFALDLERKQYKLIPREAIYEAAILRFRPIMMTTMAALLGAMPLVVGMGLGSELRRPLGVAIVGGLIFSQMMTLYTTPVIYLTLERFSRWVWVRGRG